ncbi:MAG: AAA family ATPase [Candidatus Marsarchaeota archaeon]|jgi:exonuclease SbcC|nr:AAA family ATPase [Candidatus Marsarchaeota archaeon]
MIKSITLVNWKTHEDTTLDFQNGTNIIVGLMGAGKSSMMDAISFALFGTFPALEHRRYKVEDIIMNRPRKKDSASVKLEFALGDDLYVVSRGISRNKKSEAKIEKNGKYLQTQSERVTEEIEAILKINYEVFSRAIYAEQNRLDYFLELRKGERKKQIDEMLGLDRFALAEENATSLVNSLKAIIQENEKFVQNADISAMKSKLESLSKGLESEKKKAVLLNDSAKALREQLSALKQEYQKMREENEKRIALSKSMAEVESRLSTLKMQLSKISVPKGSLTELQESGKRLSSELESADKNIESAQEKVKRFISMRSSSEAQLTRCLSDMEKAKEIKKKIGGTDINSLKSEIDAKQNELKLSVAELADSRSRLAETKKWLDELNKHESKCPICERSLPEDLKKHLLEERNEIIKTITEEIKHKESQVNNSEKELKSLNVRLNELSALASNLSAYEGLDAKAEELKNKIKSINSDMEASESALKTLKPKRDELYKDLEKNRSDMDSIKRAESLKSEIVSSEAALKEKTMQISMLKITDKDIEAVRERYNEKNAEYAKASAEIAAIKESSSRLEVQISDVTKSIAQINAIEEKISATRKHSIEVSRFKNALVDTEAQLRERLVYSINELLEGLWLGLYPYGDYSAIALRAYSDDYALEASVQIEGEDTWLPVDGVSSGGERSIACLALRIAMSMVIVPNLKWLILDEPTHNLDAQGINKMIEVFSGSLPNIVEQIFVITHDEAMKQVHNARIYEFSRDKSSNSPTEINTG